MKNREKGQGLVLFLLALAALAGIAGGTGVYVDSQVKAKQKAEADYSQAQVIVTKLNETAQTQAAAVDKQAQAAIVQAEVSKATIETMRQQMSDMAALYQKQVDALNDQLAAERARDATMVHVYEGVAIAAAVYATLLVLILAAALLWVMNQTEKFRNRLMEHSNIQIPAGVPGQIPMDKPIEIYIPQHQVEVKK